MSEGKFEVDSNMLILAVFVAIAAFFGAWIAVAKVQIVPPAVARVCDCKPGCPYCHRGDLGATLPTGASLKQP